MRAIDRFQAIMAVVFFIGTLVSAWRVSVTDRRGHLVRSRDHGPGTASMTVGTLQHRKRKVTQNED